MRLLPVMANLQRGTWTHKTLRYGLPALPLLLALAGCRSGTADSNPPSVEVITNTAEIAAARKLWAEGRERKLTRLLQQPERISAFDEESVELLREQRQRSLDALLQLRDAAPSTPQAKIHAICALKILGVAPSAEQLVGLARSSTEATMALLLALQSGSVCPVDAPLPDPFRLFVADTIRGPDTRARNAALHLAAWRNIREARDALLPLLQQEGAGDPRLLRAAARLCPSPEVLGNLEQRLRVGSVLSADGTLGAIADLAEAATDSALKAQAAKVCAAHLMKQPDQAGIDGDTMAAVSAIAKLQPAGRAKSNLAEIVRSGKWRLMRESALAELEKLEPASARQLAKETSLNLPRPFDAVTTGAPKRTVPEIAAICVRHGLLTQAEADRALAASSSRGRAGAKADEDSLSDLGTAEGFLHAANRYLAFDVETGTCPNRHDLLLQDFANASAGLFRPEALFERYEDPHGKDQSARWVETGKGRYTVHFIMGARLYRFQPRDLGDWYDVTAVLAAIHRALDDAGVAQRFVALESGGQVAAFIFAEPKPLDLAAPELGLTLGTDPEQARKLGKSYEDQVLKQLKKEHMQRP